MSLLSRLFGTNKAEKELVKHLRIFVIECVVVLIEEGKINDDNFNEWPEIFNYHMLRGTQDYQMSKQWFETHGVSMGAAKTAFYYVTKQQPRNHGELFYVLTVEESKVIAKDICARTLTALRMSLNELHEETKNGQFKV